MTRNGVTTETVRRQQIKILGRRDINYNYFMLTTELKIDVILNSEETSV